jgi:hypothetical protein
VKARSDWRPGRLGLAGWGRLGSARRMHARRPGWRPAHSGRVDPDRPGGGDRCAAGGCGRGGDGGSGGGVVTVVVEGGRCGRIPYVAGRGGGMNTVDYCFPGGQPAFSPAPVRVAMPDGLPGHRPGSGHVLRPRSQCFAFCFPRPKFPRPNKDRDTVQAVCAATLALFVLPSVSLGSAPL